MMRTMLRRATGGRWPAIRAGEQLGCPEVARLLQQFLDREIDDPVVVEVLDAHLDVCPPCEHEADTYRSIKAALAARRTDAPVDAVSRLREFGAALSDAD